MGPIHHLIQQVLGAICTGVTRKENVDDGPIPSSIEVKMRVATRPTHMIMSACRSA